MGGKQVRQWPFDHQPPAIEDRDPVADPLDIGQDVGGEDDGRFSAQARNQLEQITPSLRVERTHRLVQEQELRPVE